MNTYKGAAFYIDILGFSALTQGQVIGLDKGDYEAWGIKDKQLQNHHVLAATIIVEFRDVLLALKEHIPSIHIAHISDCAFIWSENVVELLRGVRYFMWTAVRDKGILCRGGISYGEIIEVENKEYALGSVVLGNAVTRAVHLEGVLKGPRIAMDVEFPHAVWTYAKGIQCIQALSPDLFYAMTNEIDMAEADEYRWYLCDEDFLANHGYSIGKDDRFEMTKARLSVFNTLKYHPRMSWNTKGDKALVQMKAGARAISKDNLMHVHHLFESSTVLTDKRSMTNLERANKRVMEAYYKEG